MKNILVICESLYQENVEYDIHFSIDLLANTHSEVYLVDSGYIGHEVDNEFKHIQNISNTKNINFISPYLPRLKLISKLKLEKIYCTFKRFFFIIRIIKKIDPEIILNYSGSRYAIPIIFLLLQKKFRKKTYFRFIDKFSIIYDAGKLQKIIIYFLELLIYLLSKKIFIISKSYINEYPKVFRSYLCSKSIVINFPLPNKYVNLNSKKYIKNQFLLERNKKNKLMINEINKLNLENAIIIRDQIKKYDLILRPNKKNKLCFIGMFYSFSGIYEFLTRTIHDDKFYKNNLIYLFGEGENERIIREFIRLNKLEQSVFIMGWFHPKELIKCLNFFDIGLNTMFQGDYINIFNAKNVQYLSNNNAVFSIFREGSVADFPDLISGVKYFNTFDEMVYSLSNLTSEDLNQLKKNARNFYQMNFSLDTIQDQYINELGL